MFGKSTYILKNRFARLTMPSPILSITIVHHHGLNMLRDCLISIYENAPSFEYEVIVVDNVSTDGAVDLMGKDFPQVTLIRNKERHGFGHNQNTAIRASSGKYVFIYNDDTLVHGRALSTLCEFLDANSDVGLVGPRLRNADGTLQLSCFKFPSPLRCLWENLLLTAAFPNNPIFGDYRGWAHDSVREVDFVIGAAMLVRREVLDQVGLFDELFFMYAEETDWQIRIKKAGWKIQLCPDAEITHLGGQSTEDAKEKQFAEFQSSSVKLVTKHYGTLGAYTQRACMILGSLLRIAIWSILSLVVPEKRQKGNLEIQRWRRLLRWWTGGGPRVGLS
ncbi:glycosyltransferase family 2 protein [soil metagenome]